MDTDKTPNYHPNTMKPLADCRLYAFLDTLYLCGRAPQRVTEQLCEGGADLIQLRAKQSSRAEIRSMAEKMLPITQAAGVGLVINDHLSLAQELGADFCHLGQEDFFGSGYSHVSQLSNLNPQVQLGLSTHAPEQAELALAAGADYVAIGPVYATDTKPSAKPATLDYVRWAAANVRIPWFAIGGINLQNLDQVIGAGAQRICVVSAILKSNDVVGTCRAFNERIGKR
jgi:thiamine-phosphate pyrophosphorylase